MKKLVQVMIVNIAIMLIVSSIVVAQEATEMEVDAQEILTCEEYDILQSQGVYYVGVRNLHSAICNRSANGELEGLAIDVIDMISETGGIVIEYIEIDESSDYEEIDFYFLGPDEVKEFEVISSEVYYEIPLLYVETVLDGSDTDLENQVGVMSYYGLDSLDLSSYIGDKTLVEYREMSDMKEAFNNGEIDSMIITTASLNMIRSDLKSLDFYSTPIDLELSLSFSFPLDYSEDKIAIFNKIIGSFDQAELEYALFTHASVEWEEATIFTIIEKNPMMVVNVIAVFFALVLIVGYRERIALSEKVYYDSLTGLYTQYKFIEIARKHLDQSGDKKYAIVALDVDNFKYINEIYGYETGTYILKRLATFIQSVVSPGAIMARCTGDNFLLFVEMNGLSERIDFRMTEDAVFLESLGKRLGHNYRFSFSIGIYEITDKSLELSHMIDCANIARIQGKKMLETTIHMYTEEIDRIRKSNNAIVSKMEDGIVKNEFVLYYQPKVDLQTGKMVEAEALVRWISGEEFLAPNSFIPLFEKNGFIMRLDYYVIETVCVFINLNRNVKLPKISVNISGVTLMRPKLIDELMEILNTYKVNPSEIDLEITETAFITRYDSGVEKIKRLRELGFTISLDDFGTGISSLNRLKNLDIDTLKIDRGFIIDCLENDKGEAIIRNVIHMAKDIEVHIVAEGVETEGQRAFLIEAGCEFGQGYLFAKPMCAEDFLEKVLSESK